MPSRSPILKPVGPHLHGNAGDLLVSRTVTEISVHSQATHLLVEATKKGKDLRYTMDGSDPTADIGFILREGDGPLLIDLRGGRLHRFIAKDIGAEIDFQLMTELGA